MTAPKMPAPEMLLRCERTPRRRLKRDAAIPSQAPGASIESPAAETGNRASAALDAPTSSPRAHGFRTLTLTQAAAFLKLHPEELRQRAKAGRIPGAKVGRA